MTIDRVLILGAGGMLGRAWRWLLASHGIAADALTRAELDLEDLDAVRAIDLAPYSHVVNCAAWTDVDGAEADESRARIVNGEAVAELAARCARRSSHFVTYSTDYVFGGSASSPYRVGELREPINAYGRTKAVGEEMLRDINGRWLCIRTSWVYAPWGRNFVRSIAGFARQKEELRVVEDQRGRPTSAEGLARTSLGLMLQGATGLFHATDAGDCTWFDLATEVVRLTRAPCSVVPCGSDEYPRPAARPAYSVLDISETEAAIGPMTEWREAVADVVRRLGDD